MTRTKMIAICFAFAFMISAFYAVSATTDIQPRNSAVITDLQFDDYLEDSTGNEMTFTITDTSSGYWSVEYLTGPSMVILETLDWGTYEAGSNEITASIDGMPYGIHGIRIEVESTIRIRQYDTIAVYQCEEHQTTSSLIWLIGVAEQPTEGDYSLYCFIIDNYGGIATTDAGQFSYDEFDPSTWPVTEIPIDIDTDNHYICTVDSESYRTTEWQDDVEWVFTTKQLDERLERIQQPRRYAPFGYTQFTDCIDIGETGNLNFRLETEHGYTWFDHALAFINGIEVPVNQYQDGDNTHIEIDLAGDVGQNSIAIELYTENDPIAYEWFYTSFTVHEIGLTPCDLLAELRTDIEATPDDAWAKNPDNRRNAMLNKVDACITMCSAGDFEGLANKLNHDICPKLTGEEFKNPWIIDGELQAEFAGAIAEILELLVEEPPQT